MVSDTDANIDNADENNVTRKRDVVPQLLDNSPTAQVQTAEMEREMLLN